MEKLQKTLFPNVHEGSGRKHQEWCGIFKKLLRNSECSKSENFKKLPVLAQIITLIENIRVFPFVSYIILLVRFLSIVLTLDRLQKRFGFVLEGLGSGHEDYYGTFKKLVRNSEYSKSENFKKLSVLAQILCFL